jgi:hypothetical protein
VSRKFQDFTVQYPDETGKIRTDPNLTKDDVVRFSASLAGCAWPDVAKCADAFFEQNKLKGPLAAGVQTQRVGRVVRRTALLRLLQVNMISRRNFDEALRRTATLPPASKAKAIGTALSKCSMGHGGQIIWVFLNPGSPTSPFSTLPLSDLPQALGLGAGPHEKFYAWEIRLEPNDNVRFPTAFDPGMRYLRVWRIGGLTRPDPGYAGRLSDGLPERVTSPLTFRRIGDYFAEIP